MTLPPEAGPVLLWLVAHWDIARPVLLVMAMTFVLVVALGFAWLYRWNERRTAR